MPLEREKIIEEVRAAFKGVVLGDGIGLRQGQGIDDYKDEPTCLAYREQDEMVDWEKISREDLINGTSSLSFFDAEGMRFHLPAFIIADLRKELGWNPIFHLTQLDDYALSKLTLLSPAQRNAVRNYLLFVKDEPNYEFDRPVIESALESYWTAV